MTAAGRFAITRLLVAATLGSSCRGDCNVEMRKGPWAYQTEQHFRGGHFICAFNLRYSGKDLLGNSVVVTPLGTFEVMMQSEHGDSDHGWRRTSDRTSIAVPLAGSPLSSVELHSRFYASDGQTRRPGTPPDWVYMGGVVDSGWVSPVALTDIEFLRRHPALRRAR